MEMLLFLAFFAAVITGVIMAVIASVKEDEVVISPAIPWLIMAVPLLLVWLSFITVDAGSVGVITRYGNVVRTVDPGAHFIVPVIESVHTMTTQTLVTKPDEDAASLDLQIVHTQVTLAYHFDAKYMGYIYSQLADASDNSVERKVITPAILEAIKSQTALFPATELISKRPVVRDGIETFVQARLATYHVIPETVSITDFHFSKEYEDSIEAKVTAQQNAEKAQNDLVRIKIEAEQKVAAAEGEAQALKVQKEQITPELLQLRMIEMMREKWDGALPASYYGGSAPLPVVTAVTNSKK